MLISIITSRLDRLDRLDKPAKWPGGCAEIRVGTEWANGTEQTDAGRT